jgi:6,7-dimethyl-8-ribityllumazine synthase
MTGSGQYLPQPVDCHDLRVAVVASSWHEQVMTGLLDGAKRALADFRVEQPFIVRVPGSFELPVVANTLAEKGFDAVIALGVVIRGGTPHFEYVCRAATDGLSRVALDTGSAVGFGLLTCDTEEQALDRAGLPGSSEDKGYEAASAGLVTAMKLRRIRRALDEPDE